MSARKVTHEIKLPLSLTIILGLMAFGLVANVFKPVLKVDEAFAAGQVLTKNDMKDVIDDCFGLINGNLFNLKCRR